MDLEHAAAMIAAGMAARDGKDAAEAAKLYFECLDALKDALKNVELARKLEAASRRVAPATLVDGDEFRADNRPSRPGAKPAYVTKRSRR